MLATPFLSDGLEPSAVADVFLMKSAQEKGCFTNFFLLAGESKSFTPYTLSIVLRLVFAPYGLLSSFCRYAISSREGNPPQKPNHPNIKTILGARFGEGKWGCTKQGVFIKNGPFFQGKGASHRKKRFPPPPPNFPWTPSSPLPLLEEPLSCDFQ